MRGNGSMLYEYYHLMSIYLCTEPETEKEGERETGIRKKKDSILSSFHLRRN